MRFNSNRTNQKSDFEDFARFLGMNGQRGQSSGNFAENCPRSVANSSTCTQNRYSSGARCNVNRQNNAGSVQNNRGLAMVYAEKQAFENIYDPEIALINGTMFEELYMPFERSSCRGKNNNGEGCF